jgi:ABC-2 type transport system permease protein
MTAARWWRAYLSETRFECLRAMRAPAFAAPVLILPAALYLLFGVVLAGGGRSPDINRFIFVGFCVMGVIGPGLFAFGVFTAVEREQGLLRLKRALPMPFAAYVVAKMVMVLAFAVVVTLTVIAAGLAAGKATISASELTALTAVLVAGALPFCAIGLVIGSVAGGRSAPAWVNLLYLPMVYLSGFLIPLPPALHWVQVMSPAYHLDRIALHVVGAPADGLSLHVLVLVAVTLAGSALAIRRLAAAD